MLNKNKKCLSLQSLVSPIKFFSCFSSSFFFWFPSKNLIELIERRTEEEEVKRDLRRAEYSPFLVSLFSSYCFLRLFESV